MHVARCGLQIIFDQLLHISGHCPSLCCGFIVLRCLCTCPCFSSGYCSGFAVGQLRSSVFLRVSYPCWPHLVQAASLFCNFSVASCHLRSCCPLRFSAPFWSLLVRFASSFGDFSVYCDLLVSTGVFCCVLLCLAALPPRGRMPWLWAGGRTQKCEHPLSLPKFMPTQTRKHAKLKKTKLPPTPQHATTLHP